MSPTTRRRRAPTNDTPSARRTSAAPPSVRPTNAATQTTRRASAAAVNARRASERQLRQTTLRRLAALRLPGPGPADTAQSRAARALLDEMLAASIRGASVDSLDHVEPVLLSRPERVRYLQAWDRAASHAAARRLDAIALVGGPGPGEAGHDPFGAHEVALALHIPLGAAQAQLCNARRLRTHLPATAAALSAGDISYPHALRILRAAATVDDPVVTRAAEARVLARPVRSPGETGVAMSRAIAAADPAGFEARHARAAAQSDVELTPDADAMAWLTAHLPLADAVAAKRRIDARAAAAKAAGDPRPIGLLRALALGELIETGFEVIASDAAAQSTADATTRDTTAETA
ncbi:MAG: DUF222 domain-containing protein, partial [Mycobacteriales bacterium]|nr:13E12 repeat family protein [Frankia sp.]